LAAAADPQAARPAPADTVVVHYHGTLIDGTVFDSSIQRGAPIKLAVGEVIPGWTEALQRMATGDKWRIFLPPSLAYRSRKTGSIPANSALIFEVELISIVAPGPADAPGVPPQVP
jgi:FKBP-type peptidyl-prolyl cis-trans isomerase